MLALHPGWIWISPEEDRGTIMVQATNIEFDDGTKGVWMPKGKKSRVIPMHPRLLEVVKNYGMRKPYMLAPDRPLWPADEKKSTRFDPKKALANLATTAKLPKLTYHMLRHSFATHLAQKGRTMKEIASLLGDGLVVTEKHYVGFTPNSADVLAVL